MSLTRPVVRAVSGQVVRAPSQARGARIYYFDSIRGRDTNSGRGRARAFKTLAVLPSGWKRPHLRLVGGSEWRDQILLSQDRVTIERCGPGARPVLNACDSLSPEGWTVVGDGSFSRILTLPASANGFVNLWEDGVCLTPAANQAACAATAGTYFPSAHAGTITLYVHPGVGDPASNGSTYEVVARDHGVKLSGRNATLRGIHGRNQYGNDGSLVLSGASPRMIDCRAENGHKHNALVGNGAWVDSCLFDGVHYGSNGANPLVGFDGAAPGAGWKIRGSRFRVKAGDSAGSVTFTFHHVLSGHWGRESLRGCAFVNEACATVAAFGVNVVPSPDSGKGIEIESCRFENLNGVILGDNTDTAPGSVVLANSRIIQNQTLVGGVIPIDDIANTVITASAVDFCLPGTTWPFRFFRANSGFVIEDCRFRLNLAEDYQGNIVYTTSDAAGRSLSFNRNAVDGGDFYIGAIFWLSAATQVAIGGIEDNVYSVKAARNWLYNAGGSGPANPALLQAAGHGLNGIFTGADASGACA